MLTTDATTASLDGSLAGALKHAKLRAVPNLSLAKGGFDQLGRNSMHRLLVLYNEPKDPAHFRKYYVETHLPLASKIPGVKAANYSFGVKPLGPGNPPYLCVFEADFESEAALMSALGSKEGQAVAGDVANYASGGVTMVHFPVG
jgi:uncharacterized protein (TIGR02118 family)